MEPHSQEQIDRITQKNHWQNPQYKVYMPATSSPCFDK